MSALPPNAVTKFRRAAPRIQATEQQIQALNSVVIHALNHRQEQVASTRREIEQFTRQLEMETDESSKAHVMKMLNGWREHLQWVEEKVAQAAIAVEFLKHAEIVEERL
jgi:hypothetical protein